MKLAVLFDNFGPYHLARLNATADVAETLGIEFAVASHEYDWRASADPTRFQRRILFTDGSSRECSTSRMRCELSKALDAFRPDVVAVPGWSGRMAFAALAWCLTADVPAVAMSESSAHDHPRASYREAIKSRCVAACSAALVGGQRHRDYLAQLGMPAERVFLGYDAVDNDHFARGAASARANADGIRVRYGLPRRYLLASARFIHKKNLDVLLRAYAQYRQRCIAAAPSLDPWELVLLGDGPLRPSLEQLRGELNLEAHVHMPGFRQYDELPAFYGLAAAFIHASTTEQWGLVVNEALASNLPVLVSTRCGCLDELLREGENGYGFDPSDEPAIAQSMLRISRQSADERRALGDCGFQIVSGFGPRRFADGMLRAAEAALAAPSSRRLSSSLLVRTLLLSAR